MNETARRIPVSALLIGNFVNDRLLVHDVFQQSGWKLYEARDRRLAMACLERNPVQVVITEAEVPKWDWKRVLHDLRGLSDPPQLIVASRTADDYLWSEVLNIGGYDVLPQPLERDELERVIAAACRHYDRPRPAMAVGSSAAFEVA